MAGLGRYTIRTVGCFFECDGKFLVLLRRSEKTQGGKWGLPAGKVEKDESDSDAVVREIKEETGYVVVTKKDIELLGIYTWNFAEKTVVFPTFRIRLKHMPIITYNPDEHQDYKWVTPEECYAMADAIHGLHDLLEYVGYIKKPIS